MHLDWKVRAFFLGALLAIIGIGTESQPVVFVAIAVLLVGIILRFLPGERSQDLSEADPHDSEESQQNRDDAEFG